MKFQIYILALKGVTGVTQNKRVHRDPWYRGADHKAEGYVDIDVGGKCYSHPKQKLKEQGKQRDKPPAIPVTRKQVNQYSHSNDLFDTKYGPLLLMGC